MFRVGSSEVDITPPVGAWLVGCQSASTGVHDPLKARILILDTFAGRFVLVSLDLCGLSRSGGVAIRLVVAQACKAEPGKVLLLLSHTHSAPFSLPWSITGWRQFQAHSSAWFERLPHVIASAARDASRQVADARLEHGRVAAHLGMNRRQDGLPPDTQAVMQPNPSGPVVPWSDVLRFTPSGSPANGDGAPVILFSQAAHPVMIHHASTLISADYPHFAARRLRERLGDHVRPMFAQGCGADNNAPWATGFEQCRQAGGQLGDAVADLCLRMAPTGDDDVGVSFESSTLELSLKEVETEEQLEDAVSLEQLRLASAVSDDPWRREDLLAYQDKLRMAHARHVPACMPFDIQVLAFGDELAIVALSDEVFAEYQLRIDELSPFPHTLVWACCNCTENYVPTDREHRRGGYEIIGGPLRYPYRSGPARGAEGIILSQAAQMLDRAIKTSRVSCQAKLGQTREV